MKVLLTGAFGNVGLSTLNTLIKQGYTVRVFDRNTKANNRLSKKYTDKVKLYWGDLQNKGDVLEAIQGQEIIIHVAAIIPPLADINPDLAYAVNVGGTKNLLEAIQSLAKKPKLIYTSSISIYGDRRGTAPIKTTDSPNTGHDEYAKQKLMCEDLIRQTDIDWSIFRLTYPPRLV